jgi:hypothetical protein
MNGFAGAPGYFSERERMKNPRTFSTIALI